MERDLVEERGWIEKQDYLQGLALAQLAPGPLAAQLAMYLGYAHSGILGATLTAFAFILPSFLMVVVIAAAYSRYGGLAWVQSVFYGIGAAVMAIIARSGFKLADRTIGRKPLLWILFGVMAAVTAYTGREMPALFILCGLAAMLSYAPRGWLRRFSAGAAVPIGLLAPYGAAPASLGTFTTLLSFFTKASLFVFGSGLAIVPFLYGGVVREYHWLNERQFLDAVAVAMITPGPVVITSGFIGYLVGGLAGACTAAFGVFFPVYLFVVLLTPWYRRHGKDPHLSAFVEGVTAAAVGALCGAVLILGRGAIRDVPTAAIALISLFCLLRLKLPEPAIVAAAGLAGLMLK
jgi:chromate transporter